MRARAKGGQGGQVMEVVATLWWLEGKWGWSGPHCPKMTGNEKQQQQDAGERDYNTNERILLLLQYTV